MAPPGVGLLAAEQPRSRCWGTQSYGGGETRAALRAAGHVQMIKPLPLANAIPGWFTLHDFQIDQQAGTVGYPAGYQATSSCPAGPASPVTARCASAAPPCCPAGSPST